MHDRHDETGNRKGDQDRREPAKHEKTTYKLRIDKTDFEVSKAVITGRDLLVLAGKKPPEQFQIFQKAHGGLVEIALDGTVDLSKPGTERFVTLPLDQTEGEVVVAGDPAALPARRRELRRHFHLPEHDEDFLERLRLDWETVRHGQGQNQVLRLVIYDYPVPPGYTVDKVALFLRIEASYPDTQIDMVYFLPHLHRRDGRSIDALSTESFDDKSWQRWSRHRTSENPWRPGVDDISTHLALVDHWLARELSKTA
jgi:hypothetical protein